MRNIKSIIIFLVAAFVIILGITFVANKSASPATSAGSETTNPTPTGESYTLAQVATHSTPSDCWAIVRTDVYNLTSWIASHPGGSEPIIGMCGKDSTEAFEAQHGGQKKPENELKGFEIGIYKKVN